jgi:hypothetical protein
MYPSIFNNGSSTFDDNVYCRDQSDAELKTKSPKEREKLEAEKVRQSIHYWLLIGYIGIGQ